MGELRVQRMLGTEAVYRVLAEEPDHVVVEVRRAPGLEPGQRIRLTRASVCAMLVIPEPETPR